MDEETSPLPDWPLPIAPLDLLELQVTGLRVWVEDLDRRVTELERQRAEQDRTP